MSARRFAKNHYGIECVSGTAEDYDLDERFELIVLTHILEHLYDPLCVLNKLHANLVADGLLLIEVPLWERLDKQPVGVLSFEHVNYFSEDALIATLYGAN